MSLFVAGIRPNSTYHLRGVVQFSDGTQYLDFDQMFATGFPPLSPMPTIAATTAPGMTPQNGIELLDLLTLPEHELGPVGRYGSKWQCALEL